MPNTIFLFVLTLWIVSLGLGMILSRLLPGYRRSSDKLFARKGFHVELESLRGVLAMAVVIHHVIAWRCLLTEGHWDIQGPHSGFLTQLGTAPVTMFFFLTGFLFWSRLREKSKPQFWAFLQARLRRLGPAYLASAFLLFTLVALFTGFHLVDKPAHLLKGAAEWAGFTLAGAPVLNGYENTQNLFVVVWTLRLEILFYLLIPFLGWFAKTLPRTVLLIGLCIALYNLSAITNAGSLHIAGFFLIQAFCRYLAYSFSGGLIAAHVVRIPQFKLWAGTRLAGAVAIAGIAMVLFLAPPVHGPLESSLLLLPFLIVAAGNNLFGMLRTRTLLFLGQISYSVYLVHCLVLGAFLSPIYTSHSHLLDDPVRYWVFAVGATAAVVAVATVSHRIFEWPFLQHSAQTPKSAIAVIQQGPQPTFS